MSFIAKVFEYINDLFYAIAEIWNFSCMFPDEGIMDRHIKKLFRNPEDRKKLSEAIHALDSGQTDSIQVTFSDGKVIRFFI
ncbi:hypothetical protein [Gynurincola endophyticus]|uniref:hypothetical protein n=1 Tax=Gynurincola endophyticus TaxID=2479004 RepID=UPI000F8C3EE3|nr:hypothetical protein [Gynurincola endophyticus]